MTQVNIKNFSTGAPQPSFQKVPFNDFKVKSELAYIKS